MSRSKIVRLELLLLAAVLLLLAYKVIDGPPAPEGLVVHTGIEPGRLVHEALAVDRSSRVAITATGSFASTESEPNEPMAAYGWILRRDDRSVVWHMTPNAERMERETLAHVQDTLDLEPGIYDVYFTSYGNRSGSHFGISFLDRLLGDDNAWRGDADRWQMIVRSVPAYAEGVTRLDRASPQASSPGGSGLLWSTAPMSGRSADDYVFRTSRPVDIRVYAVGEIDDTQMDFGWIEDAASGERIWEMTRLNTDAAGGWDVNRVYSGTVQVPTGIFRASFQTDPRQHFGDWLGNPPYDPSGWGMTLFSSDQDAISHFDPWTSITPIVQIDRVGDDERRSVQFRVNEPIQIAAFGLGELGDNGRYDFAWIQDNASQQTVWEMTAERSQPAGGRNNRREWAFLTLDPSTYTVTYETDGSHSYESWRHGRPDNPERWGVTLFPVSSAVDSSAIEILGRSEENLSYEGRDESGSPQTPRTGIELPDLPGEMLVDLTTLENDMRVSRTFVLETPQILKIRGIGEISLSDAYDYGWIERAETGEIVWEMTWQNTVPAGGDDKNRMFDGTLSLSAGEYEAHFRTDFSHAYGDFGDEAPRYPQSWGLRVVRPDQPPQ